MAVCSPALSVTLETISTNFRSSPRLASSAWSSGAAVSVTVAATAPQLAAWTDRESSAYASGHRATYLAQRAMMAVFVDVTERSPTFRLAPLDRVNATERKSWIQVWAPVGNADAAWDALLKC